MDGSDSMSPILLKGEVVICLNIPVCSSRPLHVSRATKMPQQARHSASVLEWRHPAAWRSDAVGFALQAVRRDKPALTTFEESALPS